MQNQSLPNFSLPLGFMVFILLWIVAQACSTPKSEEKYKSTASIATELGQWQLAAQISEQWYEMNPTNMEANYLAATNYLRLNSPNKALTILNSFNPTKEQKSEVGKREARIAKGYYMTSQFSEVLKVVENYNYPKMYRGLAREHLKALVQLEKFEELSKHLENYQKAGIYRENGKTTGTDFLYRAILNEMILTENDSLLNISNQKFQQWISENEKGTDSLSNLAYVAFYDQNFDAAITLLEKAIPGEESPRHLLQQLMLQGVCFAKMNNFENAKMQIQKIHRMDELPRRHDAFGAKFYNQARIEVAMGKTADAISSLKKALENGAEFWSYKFKEDGFLKSLFGNPQFEELVKLRNK